MKRRDLLRYLTQHSCRLVREGGEHSIWEIRRQIAAPQCHAIVRCPISQQHESASNWVFRYLLEAFTSKEAVTGAQPQDNLIGIPLRSIPAGYPQR
jgi:hypothetical protein